MPELHSKKNQKTELMSTFCKNFFWRSLDNSNIKDKN